MRQALRAGGYIDAVTDSELREGIGHSFDAAIRDWLRGQDYLQYAGTAGGVNLFTIPWNPESGYTWSIKLVSAQLSGAGTLSVYPGSTNTVAPLRSVVANANGSIYEAVATWGSNQAVLKDSREITLYCSAATITNYLLLVEQVPTEMQGKL